MDAFSLWAIPGKNGVLHSMFSTSKDADFTGNYIKGIKHKLNTDVLQINFGGSHQDRSQKLHIPGERGNKRWKPYDRQKAKDSEISR